MSEGKESIVQWSKAGVDAYMAAGTTVPSLEAGLWRIDQGREGPIFNKETLTTDELLITEGSKEKEVFENIQEFWSKKDVFKSLNFLHRRGIILHGPPGSGKTSLVHLIIGDMIKRDGVVFYCKDYPTVFMMGLKQFRQIEPERPMICLFEDLEELINNFGARTLLSLLDGENNINHCVNLATTNFLGRLDNRIIGRPKRFDRIFKIDYPDETGRRAFFRHKLTPLNLSEDVIEEYTVATKGLSFAALADVVISVKCFGEPLGKAVKTLKAYQDAANKKAKGGDVLEKSPFGVEDY